MWERESASLPLPLGATKARLEDFVQLATRLLHNLLNFSSAFYARPSSKGEELAELRYPWAGLGAAFP